MEKSLKSKGFMAQKDRDHGNCHIRNDIKYDELDC